MKTNWTPGPWFVCTNPLNDQWYANQTIGSVPQQCRVADASELNGRHEADARLISAAPELYEALDELLSAEKLDDGDPILESAREKAAIVMKKARGEL